MREANARCERDETVLGRGSVGRGTPEEVLVVGETD